MTIGELLGSCLFNLKFIAELLSKLGFLINEKKSQLTPVTRCKYLGFVLDSLKFRLELTEAKRKSLAGLMTSFLSKDSCTIEQFASMIGKISAACAAVPYGWLYTKLFERQKMISLSLNENNFSSRMTIPEL